MKLDGSNMNLGGMGLVVRKQAVEQRSEMKKVSDAYAEHSKLVFMFDVSGSMNSHIARTASGDTYTDQYIWSPEVLADIRVRIGNANNEYEVSCASLSDEPLSEETTELLKLHKYYQSTDEELKEAIVRNGMTDFLNIAQDVSKKYQAPPTRMEVVKKLAKQELNARFKKFPKSRISVVPFGDQPVTLFDDGAPEQLDGELEKLNCLGGVTVTRENGSHEYTGGGTDILKAVRRGMDLCRAKPSAVGIHHFILVTDGEDWNAGATLPTWVPSMKASGIVLDYIHIGDSIINEGLQQVCRDLGGDLVVVNCEKDLSEKFVAAMNRLCLPPAVTVE